MRPCFPTKELEEENKRLVEAYLNSKEEISIDDFFNKYASDSFKEYEDCAENRKMQLRKNGIIEN